MRLRNFANHNMNWILKELAEHILMDEPWGKNRHILSKYLNVNFEIAYDQGKVYQDLNKGIAFWKVGYLVNKTASPIWFVYGLNSRQDQTWDFKHFAYGDIPVPVDGKTIDDFQVEYDAPSFKASWRIDLPPESLLHIMNTNKDRLISVFGITLANNQHMLLRTILGEIELQKKRSDVMPHWYRGAYQFLMPLYLSNSKNVDLIAALEPQNDDKSYRIRTLLYPEYAYSSIRAVSKNRSTLIGWMNIRDYTLNNTDEDDSDETAAMPLKCFQQ